MEINGFQFNPSYLDNHCGVREALESGHIEGIPFRVTGWGRDIQCGDTYIAERNVGLKLLTCRENDKENGWIIPNGNAYPYDTGECIRIELMI